ncbi:SNF2 family N-terminal domain-containing protein [Scheffersomyces coipomensis]|uniref:SNF2 family N-terminal domain-containing protein n=1 Tax=Scheffersomyces coipomensis TaxID=1788519 RepID=UPI00315D54ED
MSYNGGRRRTSSRISQQSSDQNHKRKQEQQPTPTIVEHKKRKVTTTNTITEPPIPSSSRKETVDTKEEKLANIIMKFNLAVNELFQLEEYKSIAYWDPREFSKPFQNNHLSEPFENFLKDDKYNLIWDKEIETNEKLNSLPLRLQRKVIAERDEKLLKKFPFRNSVLKRSEELEKELISFATLKPDVHAKGKNQSEKASTSKSPKVEEKYKQTSKSSQHIKHDQDSESEDDQSNSKYKLKAIKFSLPPRLITHPSHVTSWRPSSDGMQEGNHEGVVDMEANPKPFKISIENNQLTSGDDITLQLRTFLNKNYMNAIIDESVTLDYNYTEEEYNNIMSQQQALFRSIYKKVTLDKTLELNGDKIERRKVVLPQVSIRQTSDPFRNNAMVTPKIQGTSNNLTHQDHFLNQGLAFSKVHHQMRKQHQLRTRRVAQMIEQHFKKKAGEKERLARERDQNLRRISRLAIQAVKRRWTQAYKVYAYLQREQEEELKKIKGREHLSQMLEHSTQLLEAQLNKSSREATEDVESDIDVNNKDEDDSDNFLSSSDDEAASGAEDNKVENPEDGDLNLSVDELRRKYSTLETSVEPSAESVDLVSESEVSKDEDEEEDEDIDVSKGLASLYGNVEVNGTATPQSEDYTDEQKALISKLQEEEPESIIDTASVSSIDSDSEMESSDNEDSDEEMESEVETAPLKLNGNSGLSALYGGGDDSSSEEDENPYSEASNSDADDSMTSSDGELHTNGHAKKAKDDELEDEIVNDTTVKNVRIPSLLRGTLRPYQKQGLNWLASLYNNDTNGILADEMGLGKTIQTISLLAYLACEHQIWGPHLIIVPTSVMLNWEMEFKKFAPGFKVMTYYGSPQQRAQKRKGWNLPDAFHVCITSYQLVVQDQQSFKRRRWRYMILDEAHNIKNFRSTRWKALLNFNTENRLLLTGTPLQNNLMELWSLLYFLMPSSKVNQAMPDGFANLEDFQQWFGKPVDRIMEQTSAANNSDLIDENESTTKGMDEETKNTVARLHQVLRPYLLRRLKKDVEKQMPGKYEHIVYCRLSKRQRYLYDDFMSRAKTKETLASGNFLSIINCLMQLRKVCNHPDLFEVRPIVTSFSMPKSICNTYVTTESTIRKELSIVNEENKVNFQVLNLDITSCDDLNYFVSQSAYNLRSKQVLGNKIPEGSNGTSHTNPDLTDYLEYYQYLKSETQNSFFDRIQHAKYLNDLRCSRKPMYGNSLLKMLKSCTEKKTENSDMYNDFLYTIDRRVESMNDVIEKYSVLTPPVVTLDMKDYLIPISTQRRVMNEVAVNKIDNPFHKSQVKLSIAFPDKSLLQYDCGKLQKLATLLQELTSQGHRALIFTQMTKVLDILEQFLNIHGYRYMRLDGATKIEDRQLLTERFNRDPKIPVFILSTRSGGLGINLTGADTVIFYDSDWNPAMDKQCQDRCHRIGQIRDVHIYRFVSEYTIESNILKKANQKRQLDNVVIQEGEFTTDYFGKFSVRDLVEDANIADIIPDRTVDFTGDANMGNAFAQAEDEDDRAAANEAMKEVAVDEEDFAEDSKTATATGTPAQTPAPNGTAGEVIDLDYEDGIGHIDEYMLRFISDGYYEN